MRASSYIRTAATAVALWTGASLLGASAAVSDNPHVKVLGLVVVWGADGTGSAPIASDFVVDTGTGGSAATSGDADLISQDVHTVVSGTLVPLDTAFPAGAGQPMRIRNVPGGGAFNTDVNADGVMDASDAFSAFRIGNNTDTRIRRAELTTSFYVASNAPFWIDATATPLGSTNAFHFNQMRLLLSVTQSGNDGVAFGSAAQYPNSGGAAGGIRANNRRLSTMAGGWNVFRGDQRTAASRGTLAEQSVRFDARYRYHSGQLDLADGVFEAEAEVVYTVYLP